MFTRLFQQVLKAVAATVPPGSEGMAGPQNAARAKGVGVVSGLLKRFQDDISGATAIEYALIAGLLSTMIVASATSIGTRLTEIFTSVNEGFPET